jgi:hypothetical protein
MGADRVAVARPLSWKSPGGVERRGRQNLPSAGVLTLIST